jgi:ribosome-interacting GTPase 1
MTLEEAIKTIQKELDEHPYHKRTAFYGAARLGIEALKLIKRNRRYTPQPYNIKLPGETKE